MVIETQCRLGIVVEEGIAAYQILVVSSSLEPNVNGEWPASRNDVVVHFDERLTAELHRFSLAARRVGRSHGTIVDGGVVASPVRNFVAIEVEVTEQAVSYHNIIGVVGRGIVRSWGIFSLLFDICN